MAETPAQNPEAKRAYRRIVITGIAVLAALAIFVVIARRTFLRYEFDLVTFVDDSAGVSPSSPVLLNGIGIGHVRLVSLSGSQDPNRTVRIDMRFSRAYLSAIPDDSTIAITSSNLLGDKYVNISRGKNAQHIQPGSEIRSTETQDIGSVLARGSVPLRQVNDIFDRIDRILRYTGTSQGTVGLLVNDQTLQHRIEGITAAVKGIETDIRNGRGAILHTTDITNEAQKPMQRFHEMLADLNNGKGSLGRYLHDPNSPTLTAEASAVMTEARNILDTASADKRPSEVLNQVQTVSDKVTGLLNRIDAGQGTAGQFLVNPQLRDSLNRINAELNSFMADFSKHPTRFFQLRYGLF